MKLFRARYESRRFWFEAFGTSRQQATEALIAGLERHGEQYGITRDWFRTEGFEDDMVVTPIPLGKAMREYEVIDP